MDRCSINNWHLDLGSHQSLQSITTQSQLNVSCQGKKTQTHCRTALYWDLIQAYGLDTCCLCINCHKESCCRSAPFCWLPLSSTYSSVWCFTFPRLQQQPRYTGRWPRPRTKTPNVPQLEKNHFSRSDRKTTHGSISLDPINAPNCSHPTNVFVSVSCRWIGTFDLTNECAMHAKCKVLSSRTTSTSDQFVKNIYCVSVYIYTHNYTYTSSYFHYI